MKQASALPSRRRKPEPATVGEPMASLMPDEPPQAVSIVVTPLRDPVRVHRAVSRLKLLSERAKGAKLGKKAATASVRALRDAE